MFPMKQVKSDMDTEWRRRASIRSDSSSMVVPTNDVRLASQVASEWACFRIPSEKEMIRPRS